MAVREGATSDLPYRTPVTPKGATPIVSKDQEHPDTLRAVHKMFTELVDGLYKEFNAFDIAKDKVPEERMKILLHEVEVKQGVYDIVQPLLEQVETAIRKIDPNFKRRV